MSRFFHCTPTCKKRQPGICILVKIFCSHSPLGQLGLAPVTGREILQSQGRLGFDCARIEEMSAHLSPRKRGWYEFVIYPPQLALWARGLWPRERGRDQTHSRPDFYPPQLALWARGLWPRGRGQDQIHYSGSVGQSNQGRAEGHEFSHIFAYPR